MSITDSPITSREYKLTLNVNSKLYNDWKSCNFSHLQRMIEWTCMQTDISVAGVFKPFEQFTVKYMDTPNQILYNNGWIFRVRKYSSDPFNEYSLKFRCSDRYYSASKNLDFNARNFKSVKIYQKFEEDITLDPFSSNFSPSSNVFCKDELNFKTFKKLRGGWSGISGLDISDNTPIVSVRGLKVIQEVWKGMTVKFGRDVYKIKIVLWWKSSNKLQSDLLFGEIMFRIKSEKEEYPADVIVDAHKFYIMLNTLGLNTGLVSADGMTKTKYFYGH